MYNNGKGKTTKEISEELKISIPTVVRRLRRGRDLGIVTETVEESRLKSLSYSFNKIKKPIKVYNKLTKEIIYYNSSATFAQYLIDNEEKFKDRKRNCLGACINKACRESGNYFNYNISYVPKEEIPNIQDKIIDYEIESGIYAKNK